MVPKDFEFPRGTTRRRAWELWLCGTSVGQSLVPPFRTFKLNLLPKNIRNTFKTQWLPILSMMHSTPSLQEGEENAIPLNVKDVDSSVISRTYSAATEHLKNNLCSFLWSDNGIKRNLEGWSVGTWSMKTRRNQILNRGNGSDILNLGEATRYNAPHRQKRVFSRISGA